MFASSEHARPRGEFVHLGVSLTRSSLLFSPRYSGVCATCPQSLSTVVPRFSLLLLSPPASLSSTSACTIPAPLLKSAVHNILSVPVQRRREPDDLSLLFLKAS